MTVIGVIGAAIGFVIVKPSLHLGGDTSVEKALVEAVNQYNSLLPKRVDAETQLDAVVARPPKTVLYHYSLPKRRKADLGNFSAIAKIVRSQMINTIKANEATKELVDLGVTFVADYHDRNGAYLGEIRVEPSDVD
jgi:hypothetical protein